MNAEEVERCYNLFSRSVIAAALCYVKDPADADDVAQEVFFKLYTYSGRFDSDEHIKAWLLRCAINQAKDVIKSPWRKLSLPLEAVSDTVRRDSSESDDSMLRLLQKLGRNNRVAMYMYYYEGYSAGEISDILGVSVNAVNSRLKRGRLQLRKLLEIEAKESDDGLQRFF